MRTEEARRRMNKELRSIRDYAQEHKRCRHNCTHLIAKFKKECCGREFEDYDIRCYYNGKGVYCLTFCELDGDYPYMPNPDNIKVIRSILLGSDPKT